MLGKKVKASAESAETQAMRAMFGPQQVEQQISQAISACWMMLPEKKRNVAAVAAEIRRIVERSLKNLEEDATAFGIGVPGGA